MKTRTFPTDLAFALILFLAAGLIFPVDACAGYLDPGSGSTLMQGIVAAMAACRRFFARIFGIFGGKKG